MNICFILQVVFNKKIWRNNSEYSLSPRNLFTKPKKQYKTQKKGKTIVEYEDEKEKKKDFGGDYVDYEELDKE